MVSRPFWQGLQASLGGFGRGIIERLQEIGQSVASALRLARVAGVEVEPADVVREWGEVQVSGERREKYAMLLPAAEIPYDWYEQMAIPWKRPVGYTVAIYGRDKATGRFTSQDFNVTSSRPLTPGEIVDEAEARFGTTGKSPTIDIFSIKLVAGLRRPDEPWRW